MTASSNPPRHPEHERRNAIVACVIGMVAIGITVPTAYEPFTRSNSWQVYANLMSGTIPTLAWLVGLILVLRNRVELGIQVGMIPTLIWVPLTSYWSAGVGIANALAVGVGAAIVAGVCLRGTLARVYMAAGVAAALGSILIDLVAPQPRLIPAQDGTLVNAITGIAILALVVFLFLQFPSYSLRTKFIIIFVGLAILVTLSVTLVATQAIHNVLVENSARDLRTRAQAAALSIGITMDRNVDRLQTMSLDKRVQDEVTIISDSYPADSAERDALIKSNAARWTSADATDSVIRNTLNGQLAYSLRQFSDVFQGNKELFMTDRFGSIIAATEWQPQYNFEQEGWWQIAYSGGRGDVFIGQPEFSPMINEYGIRIAIPVFAPGRQRVVGVLHGIYTLTALQRALLLNSFAASGRIDLLFPQGQILTSDGTFRALAPQEFDEIKAGISRPLETLNYRGTPLLSSQAVVGVSDEQPEPYLRSSAWRTIATIQPEEALSAVEAATRAALLAGLAAIAAAVILALGLAQYLTRPIRRLTATAEQVQAGDLSARAPVETGDEIGTLARTFNTMTARLQDTLAGLERRVAERTQELSKANLGLQSNSAYLSALSDTSAGLFERLDLDNLLQAIVERAGALVGTQNGFVFIAAHGENEIEMRVGSGLYDDLVGTRAQRGVGLAGTVWQTGEPLVIQDYQKWQGRLPGSRRDALRAVVGVPLKRAGIVRPDASETVGVIGLAYTEADREFGKPEVEILQRFAQLASIALDNARLYAESEARVAELGALNTISAILTSNDDLTKRLASVGRELQTIFGVSAVSIALHDSATRQISMPFSTSEDQELAASPSAPGQWFASYLIATREPLWINDYFEAKIMLPEGLNLGKGEVNPSYLGVPLMLGDEVLGAIGLSDRSPSKFNESHLRLLGTIAASVASTIENARLFEQTSSALAQTDSLYRVVREISAARDLQQVVKATAEGLALPFVNRVVLFRLEQNAEGEFGAARVTGNWSNGRGAPPLPVGTEFPEEQFGLIRQFFAPTPVLIDDINTDVNLTPVARSIAAQLQMTTIAAIPLSVGARQIGALFLEGDEPHAWTRAEIDPILSVASAVAVAVDNFRLLDETREALAETQRLAARERQAAEQVAALNRRLTHEGWRDYLDQLNSHVIMEAVDREENKFNGNGKGIGGSPADGRNSPAQGNSNGHGKITVPIALRGQVIGEIELEPEDPEQVSADDLGLVTHVAENIGLALDNARLFTETQRRVTELDAINRISQAVTTELELDTLLGIIGEQLREIFDVQNVYIALYEPATQTISLPYFVNDNTPVSVEPMRFGEGITSHIIRTRAPLVINERADEKMGELGAKVFGNPARSYLGVPIFVGDQVTGVISIQNTQREGMFDEASVRLLETISATVGAAIQNARLYGAMQQEVLVRQRAEEEIKLSLKEKEVLLKEIHHRVKNNLQIITSLLNLQSAQIRDPDALSMFRESQARVRSMALIHEKLYQSKDLARIDFDGYVRDLIVYLFRSYAVNPDQIRAKIETHDMFLGIDTAIPCGLIISELVTNSMKYAFPDGRRGEIYVGLAPEDDGNLALEVRDTGVGFAPGFDWRESDSLGLQLVNTLTSQLHGMLQVKSNNAGTSFKLVFPG